MSHQRLFARARLAAAAVPLVAGAAAAQLPAAHPAAADSITSISGWHQLTGAVIPGLSGAARLQALPASQRLQVGVALTDPNAAAEKAAAAAVYDPSSPAYHQFFTPAQWQARFSLPQSQYDSAVSALTSHGLLVAYTAPTRTYLTLGGTVAAVERTFGVDLSAYRAADGSEFFANAQGPMVPGGVDAVVGLQSLSVQHPKLPSGETAQSGPCVQGTCIGVVTPQDLWSIYGMPSTNRGQGQKVAVIGEGDMVQPVTDLRTWETRQGLPSVPVREHAIADDQTDISGLLEWNIDTQATTGMAPDVEELDLYFVQSLGVTAGAFSVWANDANGPQQADASFGGCESIDLALGDVQAENPMFQQAAAEGRTLFVSTGDTGGSCTVVTGNGIVNTVVPQVEYPAASPWVVAVGGTELFASSGANPQRVLEKAWEYTGGGLSISQPAQSWQTSIPLVASRCLVTDTGAPQTTAPICRGLPDVASMSGDTLFNQYDITSAGANNFGAGTSLSSPLWTGMWARVQAAQAAPGLGFAAPKLYQQGANASADVRDFFDVSVGDNGQFPALPRSAADPTGWDYVSGLGVPNVAALMQDLTGSLAPSNTGAPIGGGGSTAVSGECGSANGVLDAPEGNQLFPAAAASVTHVVASYDATAQAVTVTFTAPQMSTGTDNELDFYYLFNFAAGSTVHQYELDASYDPVMGNSFNLFDLNAPVVTSIASMSGGFDLAGGTATITMPLSTFNAATGGAMTATSTLRSVTASSGFEYDGFGGTISNGDCSFTL